MKARSVLVILLLGIGLLVLVLWHTTLRRPPSAARRVAETVQPAVDLTKQNNPITNVPAFSERLLREVPDALERFTRLEHLGHVPEGAGLWDWSLAQKTSWWGRRLDPKAFWKGRTVWLDTSATQEAQRYGRKYPPLPYDDPTFASRSDVDTSTLPAADSPDVLFRLSDKENAFWDKFAKTHPLPPEYIAGYQLEVAQQILANSNYFAQGRYPAQIGQADLLHFEEAARREAQSLGYPPEAFSPEALQWEYVLEKRREYEQQYAQTQSTDRTYASNFLAHVWVDTNLITKPLTEDQLKAADAWKIAYLQRLRREKTDESYINAYLQAWNLSANQVFQENP